MLGSHYCRSTVRTASEPVLNPLARAQRGPHRACFPANTIWTTLLSAITEISRSFAFRPGLVGVPGYQNTYRWELLEGSQPEVVAKEVETQKKVLSNIMVSARELRLAGDAYEQALPLGAVKRAEDIVKRCRLHGVRIASEGRTGVGDNGTPTLLVLLRRYK